MAMKEKGLQICRQSNSLRNTYAAFFWTLNLRDFILQPFKVRAGIYLSGELLFVNTVVAVLGSATRSLKTPLFHIGVHV